ncbi:hypothetical protein FQN49_008858, partial [Arthroderma sp. PD_2]
MKVAILLATLAGLTAASPVMNSAPKPDPLAGGTTPTAVDCEECAKYCSDPSNGSAIGSACFIVKCGIK